jgi:nucleotide-binding universal stress UspA family protein
MADIKRILFQTDFSPKATGALTYAGVLAEKYDAQLYLMHGIENADDLKLYGPVKGDYYAMEANAQAKARERLTQLQQEHLKDSIQCKQIITHGNLFEDVLAAVTEKAIDVIVVSAHTHKGFRLHLIADLPEKLVHRAPCHVFVVHN